MTTTIDIDPNFPMADILKYDIPDDLRAWESIPPTSETCFKALALDQRGEVAAANIISERDQEDVTTSFEGNCSLSMSTKTSSKITKVEPVLLIPSCPFHLFPTHFNLVADNKITIRKIIQIIDKSLGSFNEYDFSFHEELFLWKGKYLQGSSSCLIEVRIYEDAQRNINNTYFVESNRTNGDSKPFHNFFRDFKLFLSQTELVNICPALALANRSHHSSRDTCSSIPSSSDELDMEDIPSSGSEYSLPSPKKECVVIPSKKRRIPLLTTKRVRTNHTMTCDAFIRSIQPIIKMAESPYFETKLEAGRMLCDFPTSYDVYYLGTPACIQNIIMAVESLLIHADGFEDIREQAIMVVSMFLEYAGYAQEILQSDLIMSTILSFLTNPTQPEKAFETAQIRRESARIFFLLTSHDESKSVVEFLLKQYHEPVLLHWLQTFDTLQDTRLKSWAIKARDLIRQTLLKSSTSSSPSSPSS